ncbi:MAG: hypothetical protein OIF35_10380, partial [Cellvibrionaceae bacterium]|nr:hypothetical protein [Cellvibrionaceae bacterium]
MAAALPISDILLGLARGSHHHLSATFCGMLRPGHTANHRSFADSSQCGAWGMLHVQSKGQSKGDTKMTLLQKTAVVTGSN